MENQDLDIDGGADGGAEGTGSKGQIVDNINCVIIIAKHFKKLTP